MKKKKVLFVINTMGRAGAENAMVALMKQFDTKKYEIHLYSLIDRGEVFGDIPEYVIIHNKKKDTRPVLGRGGLLVLGKSIIKSSLVHASFIKNFSYLIRNLYSQRATKKLHFDKLFWKVISDGSIRIPEQFDLAIAFLEGGATYYVADWVRAYKKCAFLHIDYIRAGYNPVIDNGCYEKIDRIFAVSKRAKEIFLSVYPNYQGKTFYFHNRIDTERITKLAKKSEGFTDSFCGIRLLTIGRLTYQKAYDKAILILKRIKKEGYLVRWYVIGEGEERKRLERKIKQEGLQREFILLGAKENPYPYLQQCDIYVHETRYEGQSIAIAEAQVLKKPIVASRCTGNIEQIEDGVNGILTEQSVLAASEAIIRLIEDKELRKRLALRQETFDFTHLEELELLTRW